MQDGEKLSSESRSAEAKVRPRLRELTDSWDALIHNCREKKARLQEAYQVLVNNLTFSWITGSCHVCYLSGDVNRIHKVFTRSRYVTN